MRLNPCAFIVAGFIFISVSPVVDAAQIAPDPNSLGSTIDRPKDQITVNTDPLSNGGSIDLDSAFPLTNSSGSILNELEPNLNDYGALSQFGPSSSTAFTVPDSLTRMNTGSIDSDLQSHVNPLAWGLLLSISGLAIIAFWQISKKRVVSWHESTKRVPKCGYCRKRLTAKDSDARMTEFICLNCGKTFLVPSI